MVCVPQTGCHAKKRMDAPVDFTKRGSHVRPSEATRGGVADRWRAEGKDPQLNSRRHHGGTVEHSGSYDEVARLKQQLAEILRRTDEAYRQLKDDEEDDDVDGVEDDGSSFGDRASTIANTSRPMDAVSEADGRLDEDLHNVLMLERAEQHGRSARAAQDPCARSIGDPHDAASAASPGPSSPASAVDTEVALRETVRRQRCEVEALQEELARERAAAAQGRQRWADTVSDNLRQSAGIASGLVRGQGPREQGPALASAAEMCAGGRIGAPPCIRGGSPSLGLAVTADTNSTESKPSTRRRLQGCFDRAAAAESAEAAGAGGSSGASFVIQAEAGGTHCDAERRALEASIARQEEELRAVRRRRAEVEARHAAAAEHSSLERRRCEAPLPNVPTGREAGACAQVKAHADAEEERGRLEALLEEHTADLAKARAELAEATREASQPRSAVVGAARTAADSGRSIEASADEAQHWRTRAEALQRELTAARRAEAISDAATRPLPQHPGSGALSGRGAGTGGDARTRGGEGAPQRRPGGPRDGDGCQQQ